VQTWAPSGARSSTDWITQATDDGDVARRPTSAGDHIVQPAADLIENAYEDRVTLQHAGALCGNAAAPGPLIKPVAGISIDRPFRRHFAVTPNP
jgi:hypothetical protein